MAEHGGTWQNMAENSGTLRNMAEHGGEWQNMAGLGGRWRNIAEHGGMCVGEHGGTWWNMSFGTWQNMAERFGTFWNMKKDKILLFVCLDILNVNTLTNYIGVKLDFCSEQTLYCKKNTIFLFISGPLC